MSKKEKEIEKGFGATIGTTKSGKDVYKNYNEREYKDWAPEGHEEAASLHKDEAARQDRTTAAGQKAYKSHMYQAKTHSTHARSSGLYKSNENDIEKAFGVLEIDIEKGGVGSGRRKMFEHHYDKNQKRFFKVIGKHYQPKDDGESEKKMLDNLSKHKDAEKMLAELSKDDMKKGLIEKAFCDLGLEKAFNTEERKKLSKRGEAEKDGSFPIRNGNDLKNAIKDWGRAGSKTSDKAWIKKRAKELGLEDSLPENWKKEQKLEKALNLLGVE